MSRSVRAARRRRVARQAVDARKLERVRLHSGMSGNLSGNRTVVPDNGESKNAEARRVGRVEPVISVRFSSALLAELDGVAVARANEPPRWGSGRRFRPTRTDLITEAVCAFLVIEKRKAGK